ncbi:hypothetical protein BV25DRAFT_1841626 [Artomyces pyxidatus]|uniref:Uncharacterized protein n=1 Tax=Artomyces pyxidatus TaxID=48021 RepID=A0ACB8SNQ5_9AGAM|nr:hypothetical protein BV25DRAFT_1841626 [Artomyces pyxidatus]
MYLDRSGRPSYLGFGREVECGDHGGGRKPARQCIGDLRGCEPGPGKKKVLGADCKSQQAIEGDGDSEGKQYPHTSARESFNMLTAAGESESSTVSRRTSMLMCGISPRGDASAASSTYPSHIHMHRLDKASTCSQQGGKVKPAKTILPDVGEFEGESWTQESDDKLCGQVWFLRTRAISPPRPAGCRLRLRPGPCTVSSATQRR